MNNTLPDYEKNCTLEYALNNESQLVFNSNQTVKDTFKEIDNLNKTNDFEILVNMIRMELKEVESFLETLKQKDLVEEKKQAA